MKMKAIKAFSIAAIFTFTSVGLGAGTESKTSTGPNITDNAKATKDSNKEGQLKNIVFGAINYGIAAKYASQCASSGGSSCALAAMFYLLGKQNMMQAKAQGNTSGQASGTVYATDIGLGSSGYDPDAVSKLSKDPEIVAGTSFESTVAAGKGGFTYDANTNSVTTPKGTTIKGSDLGNSSAMEAAGVPKAAIDLMNSKQAELLARVEKKVAKYKLNTQVNGGEEGGGAGGGSGGGDAYADANHDALARASARGAGLGVDRDPAQIAGMQKNYNGEPIGVSGDSIFRMMTRRYKVKENQSSFLNESDLLIQK